MGRHKQLISELYSELARQWDRNLNTMVYGAKVESVGVSDERPFFWRYRCSVKHLAHCSAKALTDNIKRGRPWLRCPLCAHPEEVRLGWCTACRRLQHGEEAKVVCLWPPLMLYSRAPEVGARMAAKCMHRAAAARALPQTPLNLAMVGHAPRRSQAAYCHLLIPCRHNRPGVAGLPTMRRSLWESWRTRGLGSRSSRCWCQAGGRALISGSLSITL